MAIKRYRVPVDFLEDEREILDALCFSDYRPPAEELRWLVMQEARRRGLLPKMNDGIGLTFQDETGMNRKE